MAQVGWHGATDGLEYEDGPPLPVEQLCACRSWTLQGDEDRLMCDGMHGRTQCRTSPSVPRMGWEFDPRCDCPWCRAVNAPATGDQ